MPFQAIIYDFWCHLDKILCYLYQTLVVNFLAEILVGNYKIVAQNHRDTCGIKQIIKSDKNVLGKGTWQ